MTEPLHDPLLPPALPLEPSTVEMLGAEQHPLPERPRLRAVEAFPVEVEGETMLCLRDPSSITDAVLGISMDAVPILQALDGTHTIVDLQASETRRRGRLVLRSEIEELVRTLDEGLFLLSPHFEAVHAAMTNEYRQSSS